MSRWQHSSKCHKKPLKCARKPLALNCAVASRPQGSFRRIVLQNLKVEVYEFHENTNREGIADSYTGPTCRLPQSSDVVAVGCIVLQNSC
jgi:hypothetical protein